MENLAEISAALSALAAFWAAWESRKSAEAGRRAAEATMVSTYLAEYFDSSMATALRTLRQWKEVHGENFATIWGDELKSNNPEARDVDAARRHAKGYFLKVVPLIRHRLLSDSSVKTLGYMAGLNIYYDIIDPLELVLNPSRSPETIEILRKTFGRYRDDGIISVSH